MSESTAWMYVGISLAGGATMQMLLGGHVAVIGAMTFGAAFCGIESSAIRKSKAAYGYAALGVIITTSLMMAGLLS